MFDPGLNATLLPAQAPRQSVIALWSTPQELAHLIPSSVPLVSDAGIHTTGSTSPLRLHLPADLQGLTVECAHVPFRLLLDDLVRLNPDSTASRSVKALAHITKCALRVVAQGHLQPDIGLDGIDLWVPGPLTPQDLDLMRKLAGWLPPESFSADDGPTTADEAVAGVFAAVADLMPRTPSAATLTGSRPWASPEVTDVSRFTGQVRDSIIHRRSILQLRLMPPATPEQPARLHLFLRSESQGFVPMAAADIWSGVTGVGVQGEEDLLFLLRAGARLWSPLNRALAESAPAHIDLSDSEVDELLGSAGSQLATAGLEVMIPAELARPMRSAPTVRMADGSDSSGAPTSSGLFTVDSLCEVDWSVQVGGRSLSAAEIDELVESKRRMIRLDDGWVLLDEAVIKRLRTSERMNATAALGEALSFGYLGPTSQPSDWNEADDLADQGFIALDDQSDWIDSSLVDRQISAFIASVRSAMNDENFASPSGLVGELRPYQRAGLSWILTLVSAGFGGILAD
ncbi:MAG: hypothetical protein KDB26_12960, partial [Microthrixaceae bacterium]|nr:hypothetical protein [Microthrixaceae bacterium]